MLPASRLPPAAIMDPPRQRAMRQMAPTVQEPIESWQVCPAGNQTLQLPAPVPRKPLHNWLDNLPLFHADLEMLYALHVQGQVRRSEAEAESRPLPRYLCSLLAQ